MIKQLVKKALRGIGLLKAGRVGYSFVKGVSPTVLATEMSVRLGRRSVVPVPPQRLIFYVIGYRWAKTFLDSGRVIVEAMLKELRAAGVKIEECTAILDFGCGCGRMIRHLPQATPARLFGCDYNGELIAWDKANLSFAEFTQNTLAPPLPYADSSFDLIYARSVFTHLTEEMQLRWIGELRRVLRPGGALYFTTHGRQFFDKLSAVDRQRVEAGEAVVLEAREEGHNVCASFELDSYVQSRLARGFEIVRYFPGEATTHLQQDAYVLRKL